MAACTGTGMPKSSGRSRRANDRRAPRCGSTRLPGSQSENTINDSGWGSYVQIGFLTALAALAIPILIHLVFRQRPRRADLGTLRFLRVVLAHNARRRRVMQWLLLALR